MTEYSNFTVEFPERLQELDREFQVIANKKELEVTYLLMKLSAAFLLPYERLNGDSGASDISSRQSIRSTLELDKKFSQSSYFDTLEGLLKIEVDDFSRGPQAWAHKGEKLDTTVADVLKIIRHATAHSNILFGGEGRIIQHIYLGNRRERDRGSNKYSVIRCTIVALNSLMDAWISNVKRLRANPSVIWAEIEEAA